LISLTSELITPRLGKETIGMLLFGRHNQCIVYLTEEIDDLLLEGQKCAHGKKRIIRYPRSSGERYSGSTDVRSVRQDELIVRIS